MNTRKTSKTQELARWFVEEILHQEFDYRFVKHHLKAAKTLVNPDDAEPLDIDLVKQTILAIRDGKLAFVGELNSLYAVTWGNPPYYYQMADIIRRAPPPYEVVSYDDWVRDYGRLASRLGLWDGRYQGWENPLEATFRPSREAIAAVLG